MSDGKLEDASERDTQQTEQDAELEVNLAAENADALRAPEETIELIENADAAADERGEGRAGDPEFGEWTPTEDEARIEDEIDDVGDPEQTHGDGGVTGAAKDGVVKKEKHYYATAAEGDARVAGTGGEDLRGRAHQAKQVWRVEKARDAEDGRDSESNGDGLNACDGRANGILFANAASDHGGGRKA